MKVCHGFTILAYRLQMTSFHPKKCNFWEDPKTCYTFQLDIIWPFFKVFLVMNEIVNLIASHSFGHNLSFGYANGNASPLSIFTFLEMFNI